MKKHLFLSSTAIAAVALTALIGYKSFTPQLSEADALLNENIEALTQNEDGSIGYSSTHLICYDVIYYNGSYQTVANGEKQGISWRNEQSTKRKHEHKCMVCNESI